MISDNHDTVWWSAEKERQGFRKDSGVHVGLDMHVNMDLDEGMRSDEDISQMVDPLVDSDESDLGDPGELALDKGKEVERAPVIKYIPDVGSSRHVTRPIFQPEPKPEDDWGWVARPCTDQRPQRWHGINQPLGLDLDALAHWRVETTRFMAETLGDDNYQYFWRVTAIAVRPEYQRSRIGTALIAAGMKHAHECGPNPVIALSEAGSFDF
ncbi:hypothetical protein B0T25DRAFT_4375 [Lasiosphaeria hispida]|uniref:N-acetyltransferase domain-containing protein n=1 Tax=Lasiosphaeria hispida TaxID=260671 RepID=A0AAJ0HTI9_9PEZI|nr:hypothetical protein B0T25DRAFT_4375 [Lasiosphaeria hispida]